MRGIKVKSNWYRRVILLTIITLMVIGTIPIVPAQGAVSSSVPKVTVAAGEYHSLALKSDGTVLTWGLITVAS